MRIIVEDNNPQSYIDTMNPDKRVTDPQWPRNYPIKGNPENNKPNENNR